MAALYEDMMQKNVDGGHTAMAFEEDVSKIKIFDETPKTEDKNSKFDPKDLYPCLFAMCGSGGGVMLVRIEKCPHCFND